VEYLITLPKLRIDGLWYGAPFIELAETSWIMSKQHVATIEYKGKGYFSGKTHSFKATVSPAPGTGGASGSHVIEGTWHTTSKFSSGSKSGLEFHNVMGPKEEVTAIGAEASGEMGEFESRKLWNLVAKGIREGDFDLASREKSKIENEQRQRRKDELASGTSWQLKHFVHESSDPTYERLGKLGKISPPNEDMYVFKENWPQAHA